MDKITELHNYLDDNNVKLSLLHLQVIENIMIEYAKEYHKKQLHIGSVSHCACTPDETTGTTTVRCCNICGKPAESFWHCG